MITRTEKAIAWVIVILLHISLVIKINVPPPPVLYIQTTSEEIPQEKMVEVTLLPREKLITSEVQDAPPNDIPVSPKYKTDTKICTGKDKTYFGVGFIWNPQTNVITHAPEDYPAYKAGIRQGDMVMNPAEEYIDGYVTFEVVRSFQQLRFRVKGDNICYQDA